ncbi:hypothetical protein ATANTOWER_009917, partial [Ataeniobius toweri]|nr:hypothetical protein [Ataeniobius toweri]
MQGQQVRTNLGCQINFFIRYYAVVHFQFAGPRRLGKHTEHKKLCIPDHVRKSQVLRVLEPLNSERQNSVHSLPVCRHRELSVTGENETIDLIIFSQSSAYVT